MTELLVRREALDSIFAVRHFLIGGYRVVERCGIVLPLKIGLIVPGDASLCRF